MKYYFYLYEIRNNINGKVYVGVHKTKVLDDGYMGSGKVINRSIEKYGIENFTKTILEHFDSTEEMYAREKEVVTEEFLERDDTYNLRRGGHGGFDFINKNKLNGFTDPKVAKLGRINADKVLQEKYGCCWRKIISKQTEESIKKSLRTKKERGFKPNAAPMNTVESIEKKKKTFSVIGHQRGEKNSQFGKRWITDGITNKSIKPTTVIPDGWKLGRTITPKPHEEISASSSTE